MVDLPGIGASLLDVVKTLSRHAATLKDLPWPAAALLLALGAGALVMGGRQRRAVAALGGAASGFAAVHFFVGFIAPLDLAPEVAGYGGAVALLAVCALWPPAFLLLAGALPGALVGEHFPVAGHGWWGMAAGAALGAAIGYFIPRLLAACTAAAVGAALVCAGLVALSGRLPVLDLLARRPFVTAGLWAALTIAGAAFQLPSAWGGVGAGPGPAARRSGKPGRKKPKGRSAERARASEETG